MHFRNIVFTLIFLFFCGITSGQKKFKVEVKETGTWKDIYSLIDEEGKIIRQLDSSEYYVSFNNYQYVYFAVFGKKGSDGWTAIDANETELFKVYNTSFGEPSPDYLVENKIRIVNSNNSIGFANNKGEIIIKPQFEIASSFNKGKAIIGNSCQKIPWSKHAKETDCNHYSIVCEQHGFINEKGEVQKMGNYSFEQIKNEIGWSPPVE
jgi:hypothetical protein